MSRELLYKRAEEMKQNVNEFNNYQREFKEKISNTNAFSECKEKLNSWLKKPVNKKEDKLKLNKFNLFNNKDKKGAMAFKWIYALIFLFALGVFFVVFNQVLVNDILPISNSLVPDSFEGKASIVEDNNSWMTYWNVVPFILFGVVLLYMFVQSIIKQDSRF